jgi:hypothetical protein
MLYVFILFTFTYPVQQSLQEIVKKNIGFYATDIITLLIGQILPKLPCRLVGDGIVWTGRGFLSWVRYYWKPPSLQISCVRLSVEIGFSSYCCLQGKKLFTHIRAAEHCSHSKPKSPEQRKYLFWQVRIKILQFWFRKLLIQVSITLQIDYFHL